MKKTNIRVRRNGGSKTVSSQVPNKPEPARARTSKTGQRFEGIVKWIDAELEYGFIGVAPELAARLKVDPEKGIIFRVGELSEGRCQELRAGARVTFRPAANERGLHAVELNAITLAADLPTDGWKPITCEFITSTIELHETKCGGGLNRDKFGRLFVSRKVTAGRGRDREYREVSFAQACDWLVNEEHEMIPERFLAKHGIMEQARLACCREKFAALRMDAAVESAFALIELMEYPLTKEDDGALPEDRKQSFTNGIINLTFLVQNQLLALKENYRAAMKAGVQ